MNAEIETLISVLRGRMKTMTDDERLELINAIVDGYCTRCGCPYPLCPCWDDE